MENIRQKDLKCIITEKVDVESNHVDNYVKFESEQGKRDTWFTTGYRTRYQLLKNEVDK